MQIEKKKQSYVCLKIKLRFMNLNELFAFLTSDCKEYLSYFIYLVLNFFFIRVVPMIFSNKFALLFQKLIEMNCVCLFFKTVFGNVFVIFFNSL